MPNNPHYRKLMQTARRNHLANIKAVSKEIEKLYRDAALELAEQAIHSGSRTLDERWRLEYSKSLHQRAEQLAAGLYETTLQGLKRSASLPSAATQDFFSAIGGNSFRDVFAGTPDDVLTQILSGEIYKDKRGLSPRIWGTAKGLEKDVDYIVNRGIAEKKSAYKIAKDLEAYVQKPAARDWDWGKVYPNMRGKKIDYNAQRLARTAINHSYWLSNVKTCQKNPFVEAMHWELSSQHWHRQIKPFGRDECDDYAEQDKYGLGTGNFPADELPLPHPQCLCVQYAVIPQSLEEIGDELGAWMAGEPNERLDAWYEKEYGNS